MESFSMAWMVIFSIVWMVMCLYFQYGNHENMKFSQICQGEHSLDKPPCLDRALFHQWKFPIIIGIIVDWTSLYWRTIFLTTGVVFPDMHHWVMRNSWLLISSMYFMTTWVRLYSEDVCPKSAINMRDAPMGDVAQYRTEPEAEAEAETPWLSKKLTILQSLFGFSSWSLWYLLTQS